MKHSKKIPVIWIKNLPADQKKSFENLLRNSTRTFRRTQEILKERLAVIETQEVAAESFEDPNWAYRQAYINGRKKEIKDLNRS